MSKISGDRSQLFLRRILLIGYDMLAVYIAGFLALFIRFEFRLCQELTFFMDTYHHYFIVIVPLTLLLFGLCHLYSSLWTFAGATELANMVGACILAALLQLLVVTYLRPSAILCQEAIIRCFARCCSRSYLPVDLLTGRYGQWRISA